MNENDRKAPNDIEKHGCHVLKVMEGDGYPCFAYSIGINKTQKKPDIAVIGLDLDLAHSMINNYNNRLLQGECFESGLFYSDFLDGFDVCFIEVAKKHFNDYFGWGLWLHQSPDFEVLQLVWPTIDGLWPWDTDKSEFYMWAQPILNEDGTLQEI